MKILPIAACTALLTTSVLAYTGQSDWAEDSLRIAEINNIVPYVIKNSDVSQPITRAEFAAVAVRLYDAMSEDDAEAADYNPFTDTSDRDVLKAYAAGIVNGITDKSFEPGSPLSREQAAAMLGRVYMLSRQADLKPEYDLKFADDSSISQWAKPSVYFMSESGILDGVDGNRFAPGDRTSREQAIVIAARMLERYSPEPIVTLDPMETVSTPQPTESSEKLNGELLGRIPKPGFGTIITSKEDEYGATVVVAGATIEDFDAYSEIVEGIFPIHINNLANSFVINSDGSYEIKVNYADGTITITLEAV